MKKPQTLHPWGWLSLCFKPGKSALRWVLLGAQILARIIDGGGGGVKAKESFASLQER